MNQSEFDHQAAMENMPRAMKVRVRVLKSILQKLYFHEPTVFTIAMLSMIEENALDRETIGPMQ